MVFPLDRRITIVARVRTRELFAFVLLLTRGHNYDCCWPSILLSFNIVFFVEDEESSGDEGEASDAKEAYKVPRRSWGTASAGRGLAGVRKSDEVGRQVAN